MMGVRKTVVMGLTPVAPSLVSATIAATGIPIMMTAMLMVSPTTTDHMPPIEA